MTETSKPFMEWATAPPTCPCHGKRMWWRGGKGTTQDGLKLYACQVDGWKKKETPSTLGLDDSPPPILEGDADHVIKTTRRHNDELCMLVGRQVGRIVGEHLRGRSRSTFDRAVSRGEVIELLEVSREDLVAELEKVLDGLRAP